MSSPADPAHRLEGRRLQRLLVVTGIVEVMVGLLHFVMPTFYRRSPGLADLSPAEADFVALVTFAVGILLIAFGALTLGFSRHPTRHLDVLLPYLVVKSVLWAGRLALEIVYPVRLDMFGIDPFTVVVAPGVAVELLLFVVATYQAWQLRQHRLRGGWS
jgi:hypothetical protein